jgi:nitroimidazol reductase NimA-like FMN-containing flavoprotein (pyridoxamine 5'-phosphate oxidase superfamily)
VGFLREGAPSVLPTVFARRDAALYLHGSTANRAFRSVASGEEVCIEVTLLDGIVLARSAFHHSVNYRSVVIYGRGSAVTDEAEKLEALRRIVEHACPGRWREVRPPSPEELVRTLVVKVPIDEASAKVRRGGPVDDEADLAAGCWAGVLPLHVAPAAPEADALLPGGVPVPDSVSGWRRSS